jgi:hypothetical protein
MIQFSKAQNLGATSEPIAAFPIISFGYATVDTIGEVKTNW